MVQIFRDYSKGSKEYGVTRTDYKMDGEGNRLGELGKRAVILRDFIFWLIDDLNVEEKIALHQIYTMLEEEGSKK